MNQLHSFTFKAMNTEFDFRIPKVVLEEDMAQTVYVDVLARVQYLEEKLSRFISASDIANINDLKDGEEFIIDRYTLACLKKAIEVQQLTNGIFSIQAGRFKEDDNTINDAGSYSLLEQNSSILCVKKGLQFDLGAIGKGFALDCLEDVFEYWNLKDYFINAGNSSILASNHDYPSWNVIISQKHNYQFKLINQSISSSGDKQKSNHIKYPSFAGDYTYKNDNTWVICESAAYSDAIATACMLMDGKEIQDLVNTATYDLQVITNKNNQLNFYKQIKNEDY